jgi:hypothetical protein
MKSVSNQSTEGDVETNVILPLLTEVGYLGIPKEDLLTKNRISARDIGKGSKRKIGYVPDYCVIKHSLPVLVVEAKRPTEDLLNAYQEARLYASELNSSFPHGVNPCCRIISTNGIKLAAGYWDAEPQLIVELSSISQGTAVFDRLFELVGNKNLEEVASSIGNEIKLKQIKRPFNQGSGPSLIASRLEPNSFAADLTPVLRRYFSSKDQARDQEIYRYAYVSSNEVTGYDRILESFLKDRLNRTKRRTEITTTKSKANKITEVISQFDGTRPTSGDLQLVTGSVGVGKSLFARRYKEFLQPDALKEKGHWAFLDFNNAPENRSKWDEWSCETFVRSVIEEGAPLNLRDPIDQERIFSNDLADRQAYYNRMQSAEIGRGNLERARDIEQWRQDPKKLCRGIAKYLQGDRGDNLIVVFDNVDRRDTEDQLAAFNTALWFMDQTRCLVILQLRDSTFEAFKHQPPLDTYRTGQIFHISPPRFSDVVKRRLELSTKSLESELTPTIKFYNSNGVSFSYPTSRAAEYLKAIYEALFQRNNNVARVLEALAGRNVRRALDMFMAIITSGHMPEEMIAAIAQGRIASFPSEYRILRALMRQDYRYFNNNTGFVANIFHCESSWERPSNLLIPELLFYLIGQRKPRGENGQMGFVAMERLVTHLIGFGFLRSDISEAAHFCLQKELLEVETSSSQIIHNVDSVKVTAAGWAHLRLLSSRLEYLAALLPTTPIDDPELVQVTYDLMQIENRTGNVSLQRLISNVERFEKYIASQERAMSAFPAYFDSKITGSKYILEKIHEALLFALQQLKNLQNIFTL